MEPGLELTDIELKFVWAIIEKMKHGEIISIKTIAPNRPKEFIQACKMYIDCYNDLEFNGNYSKINKLTRILTT